MLSYVVAMSENNVIGMSGRLPWHLPEDLKKFKEITSSGTKTMIMGRKTFESLPRILPGRKHVILTRSKDFKVPDENVQVLYSLDKLTPFIESKEEYYVIGGGELFVQLMPYVSRIYLTILYHDFIGDTLFPEFDKNDWKITESYEGPVDENNKYKHTYLTLDRI